MHAPTRSAQAYSLVEILVILAAMGILAALATSGVSNFREGSRVAKLQSDVATINQAIDIYLANGGRLTDVESYGFFGDPIEQKVLDKLKTRRNRFSAKTYVGFGGEMLDKRVAARMQDTEEGASKKPRSVWDPTTNHFAIQVSGKGVREFYLNEELADHRFGVDESRRSSVFDWNTEGGWIWNYKDRPLPQAPPGPTVVALADPSTGGGSSVGSGSSGGGGTGTGDIGSGGDGEDEEEENPGPRKLNRPFITPDSGIYPASSFPMAVTVENPNTDAPESMIMVSLNGGSYTPYSGPFPVPADTSVRAHATGPPELYLRSESAYEKYTTQLAKPWFSPWPKSYPMNRFPMEVSIHHSNDSSAWIMYSMDGGEFQPYAAPISVEPGTHLQAYVQPPSDEWGASSVRGGTYTGYKLSLKPVSIATSASEFDENVDTITVTIQQPAENPIGGSEIRFAITEKGAPEPDLTSFLAYGGPFAGTYDGFPNGFTVFAYSKSLDEEVWYDGPMRSVSTSVDFFGVGVAKSTLFILDFSGSMDQQFYLGAQTRLEVLKSEMATALEGISEHDRFGVLIFSSIPLWVTAEGLVAVKESQTLEMHPGTEEAKAQVNAVINSTEDRRYTNFVRALSVVDQVSPQPEQIIFLTDGTPTVGDGSTEDLDNEWLGGLQEIVDLGIPVHSIGVDLKMQSRLDRLDYIAEQTGGTSILVGDPNLVEDEWAP